MLFIVCLFSVLVPSEQMKHPKASPFTTLSQDVGLTNIKVAYSRPAVRGRKIFGDLVPYGRIWRVGANASTKITFSNNVIINDRSLEKGTYALYAFSEADIWEIVFHKNTSHWGDGDIRNKHKEHPSVPPFYGTAGYFQEERVKSLVEAALQDHRAAVIPAQKSLELANRLGKDGFVRMNEKHIRLWKAILAGKNEG